MPGIDQVTLTMVTDNYVDMLLPDFPRVTRTGLQHHFDPKTECITGENGILMHVEIVAPSHCTGMEAIMEIAHALPDRFLSNVTGSSVHLQAGPRPEMGIDASARHDRGQNR